MINTIKADIEYILGELAVMRNKEDMKTVKNEALKYMNQDQVGFVYYTKDYRPYRIMVDTLIKNFDNLNKICCYKLYEFEKEFVDKFLNNLTNETENLHKLKESCKGEYEQYRCLSDAFIKLTDKICRIERDKIQNIQDVQKGKMKELDKELLAVETKINEKLKSFESKPKTYSIEIYGDSVEVADLLTEKYPEIFQCMKGLYIETGKPVKSLNITL